MKYSDMKGIILAGGSGTRLFPITEGVSKQLLPIYDKPMIYYPLCVLLEAGIKDILIITTKEDQKSFQNLLKDGSQLGIKLTYMIQEKPNGLSEAFLLGEDFIKNQSCCMILGDNIFYGENLKAKLLEAKENACLGYASIFGYEVDDPKRFGVMEIDDQQNVLSVEEKPLFPKSHYAITGLYFYPSGVSKMAKLVKPSKRGELEITSLNDLYLKKNLLKASLLDKDYMWFDTGTFSSMYEASTKIKEIEDEKDIIIASPEIIAYKNKWIKSDKLRERGELLSKNSYGNYLLKYVEKR